MDNRFDKHEEYAILERLINKTEGATSIGYQYFWANAPFNPVFLRLFEEEFLEIKDTLYYAYFMNIYKHHDESSYSLEKITFFLITLQTLPLTLFTSSAKAIATQKGIEYYRQLKSTLKLMKQSEKLDLILDLFSRLVLFLNSF